jgi:competence ComEA-like helix-hairpin-helix protein
MKNKEGKTTKLSPAWWIAYGVLCGLGAAGFILLVASRPRGEPIQLIKAPTHAATNTAEPQDTATPTIAPAPTLAFPLDINTATAAELEQLPGIGPTLAQSIVTYREMHGFFETVADIQKVPEIGPITYEAIFPFIIVSQP